MVQRIVRKDNGRILGDVLTQELRIEVVIVQVRDEEVVGPPDLLCDYIFVTWEGESRSQVGWVEPRVAENTSVASFNEQARLTEKCKLQL